MTIKDYYPKLIKDGFCEIDKKNICPQMYLRYYNPATDKLPFCIVKQVFPNRLKVQAYKGKRAWFVSFDKVNRFFTKQDKTKRYAL